MPLTDIQCRNAKPEARPYKLTDGGGLHLLVVPTGGRHWRFAYRHGGKQKTLALGSYPATKLVEARDQRDAAKRQLRDGLDPTALRREAKRQSAEIRSDAFEAVALEWFAKQVAGWVPAHAARVRARLQRDVFPVIGTLRIGEVTSAQLLEALRQVEARGALDVAKRIRQTVGAVFRYAISTGRAARNPAVDLVDAMARSPRVTHHAYLREKDLPEFLQRLDRYDGEEQTRLALGLTMLTLLRTNEVRFARRAEFEGLNGSQPLWRIPAERMKQGQEHLVPLCAQAVRTVKRLIDLAGEGSLLLPGPGMGGVMSQNTMIFALYRMGYHSRATVHGFRRTASTILNERGFNRDWIERQLAHSEANEIRAAYNAAEWLTGRREMLVWWANHLDALRSGSL